MPPSSQRLTKLHRDSVYSWVMLANRPYLFQARYKRIWSVLLEQRKLAAATEDSPRERSKNSWAWEQLSSLHNAAIEKPEGSEEVCFNLQRTECIQSRVEVLAVYKCFPDLCHSCLTKIDESLIEEESSCLLSPLTFFIMPALILLAWLLFFLEIFYISRKGTSNTYILLFIPFYTCPA